ncbi:MAG: hypothetical protein GX168_08050 [Bacteroidales bacterium]|jgi:hypothetical protein|nr:hypothetical protein [Bacteroidales bacterium]
MKRYLFTLALPLILIFLAQGKSYGQYYNTLYWLQGIPQSTYSNPALMPQASIFIGMPGLSSIYAGVGNSGFALRDILRKDGNDEFYWDEDHLLSKLGKHEYMDGDASLEVLSFGFRAKRNYLTFSLTDHAGARFGYPHDFLLLLFKGNDQFMQENRPGNFDGLGFDYAHYREYAMSFSREITDRFYAGIRLKALHGLSSVWFERSDLSLKTAPDTYDLLLDAKLLVNISSPLPFSPLDSLDEDFEFDPDIYDYMTNTGNLGGGIDFGLSFKATDNLTLAFSANDLGTIHWKQGVENFEMQGEFEFEGIELEEFFSGDEEEGDAFDNLLDSLKSVFDISESNRSFRQVLPAKLYASVAYDLSPRHKLALLNRTEIYKGQWYPSFTLSYNVKPIHAFSLALSYSVIHWNYTNLGVGFNLNLGPLQLYLVSNNFFGAIQPHTLQATTLHAGLNWVFSYRPRKEQVAPMFSW